MKISCMTGNIVDRLLTKQIFERQLAVNVGRAFMISAGIGFGKNGRIVQIQ